MKWEVGKKYENRVGEEYVLQAVAVDGRLIFTTKRDRLVFRKDDGTDPAGARFRDIINPNQPTDEERAYLARILKTTGYAGMAAEIERGYRLTITPKRLLTILREFASASR